MPLRRRSPQRLIGEHRAGRPRQARRDRARALRARERRPRAARGRAGNREDDPRALDRADDRRHGVRAHPVHARPAADGRHRPRDLQPEDARVRVPARARSSRTSSSSTRSTARCRARSRRCSRRWPSGQVTVDGVTRPLPAPFLVIATENPIEQEGTFPLPEAQLDRFALRSALGYPSDDEEVEIVVAQRHGHPIASLQPQVDADDVETLRAAVEDVYVDELVLRWIVDLVRATRQRRRRLDRRVRPRQPDARAHGARVGADAGTRPRRPRRRRARCSCPCSATACCSRRRSSRRRARSAATRRCSRSRSAASSSRRRRRPTGTARPPASRACARRRTPHLSARAAAAARRASVRRPAEPAARPRQRRDRDAPVRDRRSGLDDRLVRKRTPLLCDRTGRVHRPRPRRRRGAARRRSSATAGRRWASTTPPLPWLSKPRVVAEATAALVASAIAARADVASLDYGEGEPYWLPPGRKDVPWLVQERQATAAFDAAEDNLADRALVPRPAAQRPADRARSSSCSRTSSCRRRPTHGWTRVARGWDVVPVVIQDPVWEQSFPDVALGRGARRGSAERTHRARAAVARAKCASCASRNEQRLAASARGARLARSRAGAARNERSVRDRPRLHRVGGASAAEPVGALRRLALVVVRSRRSACRANARRGNAEGERRPRP